MDRRAVSASGDEGEAMGDEGICCQRSDLSMVVAAGRLRTFILRVVRGERAAVFFSPDARSDSRAIWSREMCARSRGEVVVRKVGEERERRPEAG